MSQKFQYQYIKFEIAELKPKTEVYNIYSNNGVMLGQVKWFAQWRQYTFFPTNETIFSKGCLRDIEDFIQSCMDLRKKK